MFVKFNCIPDVFCTPLFLSVVDCQDEDDVANSPEGSVAPPAEESVLSKGMELEVVKTFNDELVASATGSLLLSCGFVELGFSKEAEMLMIGRVVARDVEEFARSKFVAELPDVGVMLTIVEEILKDNGEV